MLQVHMGMHPPKCRSINLAEVPNLKLRGGDLNPDESCPTTELTNEAVTLPLTVGQSYTIDIFQAERHTDGSNFRMTTSISFENKPTGTSSAVLDWSSPSLVFTQPASYL